VAVDGIAEGSKLGSALGAPVVGVEDGSNVGG